MGTTHQGSEGAASVTYLQVPGGHDAPIGKTRLVVEHPAGTPVASRDLSGLWSVLSYCAASQRYVATWGSTVGAGYALQGLSYVEEHDGALVPSAANRVSDPNDPVAAFIWAALPSPDGCLVAFVRNGRVFVLDATTNALLDVADAPAFPPRVSVFMDEDADLCDDEVASDVNGRAAPEWFVTLFEPEVLGWTSARTLEVSYGVDDCRARADHTTRRCRAFTFSPSE